MARGLFLFEVAVRLSMRLFFNSATFPGESLKPLSFTGCGEICAPSSTACLLVGLSCLFQP